MGKEILTGTYEGDEEGGGIHLFEESSGFESVEKILKGADGCGDNNFVEYDSENGIVYTTSQLKEDVGGVAAYRINRNEKTLELISQQPTGASRRPSHIKTSPHNDYLLSANYEGSVSVNPIDKDGSLGEKSDYVEHQGSSVKSRQDSAHPHSVNTFETDERVMVYVPDLGTDEILVYELTEDGELEGLEDAHTELEEGYGPRHMEIVEDTGKVYLINELHPSVTVFDINQNTGKLDRLQNIKTVPESSEIDQNLGADIHSHPSEDFLYSSTRGEDILTVFEIQGDGKLSLVDTEPSRGESPRNFSIGPEGENLIVANRDSANLSIFDIDAETGELEYIKEITLPEPGFVELID